MVRICQEGMFDIIKAINRRNHFETEDIDQLQDSDLLEPCRREVCDARLGEVPVDPLNLKSLFEL